MSRVFSMSGMVDGVFTTIPVEMRRDVDGEYVDGIYVPGTFQVFKFDANIQTLTDNELEFFLRAEQRIIDVRKLYISDGPIDQIKLNEYFYFYNLKWKVIRTDIREEFNYVKVFVDRYDDQ